MNYTYNVSHESILRAWCKTIVTTLFYIISYNSLAPSPEFDTNDLCNLIIFMINMFKCLFSLSNINVWYFSFRLL